MHQDILSVLSRFSLSETGGLSFEGKPMMDDRAFYLSNNDLKSELADKLYQCYNYHGKVSDTGDYSDLLAEFINVFRSEYVRWKVEHENFDGSIIATDGTNKRFLQKGEYMFEGICQPKNLNRIVQFFSGNSFINSSFYNFYHHFTDEFFPHSLLRFYFNISPKDSPKWVECIIKHLLNQEIYFQGKCLYQSQGYERSDTAVLYIFKKDLAVLYPKLMNIFEDCAGILRPQTPLFTLHLRSGIGFAENPANPNESFGTCRCRLITEGIWAAHQNKLSDKEWTQFVIRHLEQQGYQPDRFYLNPYSTFQYKFG